MEKRCLGLLLAVLLLALPAGCAKNDSVLLNEGEVQTDDKRDEEGEAEVKAANGEEVEIELPNQQDLKTDYTTVKGMELAPGSHIAVVVKGKKSNYWKAVQIGMQKAIDDLNAEAGFVDDDKIYMTFEAPDDESDAEAQINIVDAVLAENPQVLCLAAIDMSSCEAQLETAEENGIPVIILDSGVITDELVYTVCKTDNKEAGREAARRLCQGIGGSGEVLVVVSQQQSESVLERVQGFLEETETSFRDVKVSEVIYADSQESGLSVKERIQLEMEQNPNLKGCFAANEEMAADVLDALQAKGETELLLVGFDSGARQLEAVCSEKEYGIVCQNPYGMGYATVASAARAILGLENDKIIDAGYQWIDSSNITREENQKYLYE